MKNEILKAANLYDEGFKQVQERKKQWLDKYKELRDHLKEIATFLNDNAGYPQGFFVDTLHAYNKTMNGTCHDLPSVTFRSGDMSMLVAFRNSVGEKKEFEEEGFRIFFNPTVNGQLLIMLQPHSSDLNDEPPKLITLAVIDQPAELKMDMVDLVIVKGIQIAFTTSFTSSPDVAEAETEVPQPRNPIGFKRYETTEKVK